MGAHHMNGNALMKANGVQMPPKNAQQIQLISLGDDYVSAGFSISQALDGEGNLCAVLSVAAGKLSTISGLRLGVFQLSEMGKIPVERIRELVDKAMAPKVDEEKPA